MNPEMKLYKEERESKRKVCACTLPYLPDGSTSTNSEDSG